MAIDAPTRRYFRRMVAVSAIYVAAIFAASSIIPDDAKATPLTVAIALVPGIAVLAFIWAIGSFLAELTDEYLRFLEVRKALIATAMTLALTATWGILEIYTDVPRIEIFWVFPLWCIGLGVGALVNKLTLGDGGCP
ncbi:hypothetical protein K5P26_02095 [Sphingopyxis sp. XHP0097]|jgi:hypothetical protein|uniref:Uncharacterized protein n=1 Tax=Sphingopyxis jiangsuensis TaxID=2871171 RepID=A0ABS7MB79_9SPHN|nr:MULTISPECIES: hypothetical protein [Sphingopyxis]MBL0768356.1 hypothetical protein [Sphingopyxis lutea]MBY4635929.1 hypothetical protein [Sphingopyxis jiangsuensis]